MDNHLKPFNSLSPCAEEGDLLPMVLVYSESGTSISPCGGFLAVCLPSAADLAANCAGAASGPSKAPQLPSGDAMAVDVPPASAPPGVLPAAPADGPAAGTGRPQPAAGEAANHGLIAIISLQQDSFAQVLCTSPIPKAAKITCIRFSASCRYLLVGYGLAPRPSPLAPSRCPRTQHPAPQTLNAQPLISTLQRQRLARSAPQGGCIQRR